MLPDQSIMFPTSEKQKERNHITEKSLNECLLFKIGINKSTSINVITERRNQKKDLKSLTTETHLFQSLFYLEKQKLKELSRFLNKRKKNMKIFHARH